MKVRGPKGEILDVEVVDSIRPSSRPGQVEYHRSLAIADWPILRYSVRYSEAHRPEHGAKHADRWRDEVFKDRGLEAMT